MAQVWGPRRTQDEVLQIDGFAEKGERGTGHPVEVVQAEVSPGVDFEVTEEWNRAMIDFRKLLDVLPEAGSETNTLHLLSMGGKQLYNFDGTVTNGEYA